MNLKYPTKNDFKSWAVLRHKLWPQLDYDGHHKEVRSWFYSPKCISILLEVDDRIVGFIEGQLRDVVEDCKTSPVGYIEGWYVDTDFRGKGFGRELLRKIEEWFKAEGCQEIASDTELDNVTSYNVHLKCGFKESSKLIHLTKKIIDVELNMSMSPHSGSVRRVRTLVIALISDKDNRLLLHEAFDSKKDETFYRPMGGGVEFGEASSVALVRKIKEEINKDIIVGDLVGTVENIYTFEGKPGHEIVLVYKAKLVNPDDYNEVGYEIIEKNRPIGKAVWKSYSEIKEEGSSLYPEGIIGLL